MTDRTFGVWCLSVMALLVVGSSVASNDPELGLTCVVVDVGGIKTIVCDDD